MTIQPFDIAIDLGDAQPKIDWAQVYATGIRIAMIKATEGTTFKSRTFDAQNAGAREVGIEVVPYHFLAPGNASSQAALLAKVAGLTRGSAFALDWEGRAANTATSADAELIGETLFGVTARFPLGYWGIPGSTPAPPTIKMQSWDRWIPRYPKQGAKNWAELGPTLQSERRPLGALFWQYTCWGQVPGIPVNVDRSVVFANSVEEALAWCKTGVRPAAG